MPAPRILMSQIEVTGIASVVLQIEVNQFLRKLHQGDARLLLSLHHFFELPSGVPVIFVHKGLLEELLVVRVRAKETEDVDWKFLLTSIRSRRHCAVVKRTRLILMLAVLSVGLSTLLITRSLRGEASYRGKSASIWVQKLQDGFDSEEGFAEAMEAFKQMGPPAVPFLLQGLRRDEPMGRRIYRALWFELPALLQDKLPRPKYRDYEHYEIMALMALRSVGPRCSPSLVAALKQSQPEARRTAAQALGKFGSQAVTVVPALAQALADPDVLVRFHAAGALGEIGPSARAAVPALIKALNDSDRGPAPGQITHVRERAATALGKMGFDARAALPALQESMKCNDARLRVRSSIAVWRIQQDAETTLPILIEQFASCDDDEKLILFKAFGEMGSKAKPAIPLLVKTISEKRRIIYSGRYDRDIMSVTIHGMEALKRIDREAAESMEKGGVSP